MRSAFEDEELEPVKSRRDTELTLGSGALLTILLGLVVLCVACFGLGYVVGHRSASPAAALPVPSQPLQAGNGIAKPPATAQPDQAQSPDAEEAAQPQSGSPPPANDASAAQAVPAADAAQPSVHPVLPSASAAASGQPVQGTPAPALQPAGAQASAAPAGSFAVQIAAVSNVEDAQVLADALRKRGYAVTARRDPTDNLIHVRIGPFASLAEANTWKMKLLNDGYNAVVQQ
jgi:cell division septation protein DedD